MGSERISDMAGATWQSVAEPGSRPVAIPSQRHHPRPAGAMHADHRGEAQTTACDNITAVPSAPPSSETMWPSASLSPLCLAGVKGESPHLQGIPPAQTSGV